MSWQEIEGRVMNTTINPNMIVLARESRGLTQKELASLLKITQGYMSKIENGLLVITEKILSDMVRILKYPTKFFFDESPIYPPDVAFYRKYKSLSKKAQERICAIANVTRLNIEKMLRPVEIDHNTIPDCDIDEYGTPEQVAMALREFWSLPRGPIPTLTKVIEDAAIVVRLHQVDTNAFSGMNLPIGRNYYLVFMNARMPWDRIRWTEAHELGHILMHRLPSPYMEEEADRFAAEFLMPADIIRSELSHLSLEQLASLKLRWRVSMAALLKRALTLKKITERQYRYFWMQMGKLGWRLCEPPELEPPQESMFLLQELVKIHMQDLNYTLEELSNIVGMYEDEFAERYTLRLPQLRIVKRRHNAAS
jgi:Zn-dependent peptidase ImmA (M78 family)/DNA-binding XRE family transcriptional regulator